MIELSTAEEFCVCGRASGRQPFQASNVDRTWVQEIIPSSTRFCNIKDPGAVTRGDYGCSDTRQYLPSTIDWQQEQKLKTSAQGRKSPSVLPLITDERPIRHGILSLRFSAL